MIRQPANAIVNQLAQLNRFRLCGANDTESTYGRCGGQRRAGEFTEPEAVAGPFAPQRVANSIIRTLEARLKLRLTRNHFVHQVRGFALTELAGACGLVRGLTHSSRCVWRATIRPDFTTNTGSSHRPSCSTRPVVSASGRWPVHSRNTTASPAAPVASVPSCSDILITFAGVLVTRPNASDRSRPKCRNLDSVLARS